MSTERTMTTGLIVAPHTPFAADGSLNLAVVERQAEHFIQHGISRVFAGGTTGECHSLSLQERLALAQRWLEVTRGSPLGVMVHVGSNCAVDARQLAAQAARLGALAIAAVAPSYFRPGDVDSLVNWCDNLASAAPETPFYYYDIPAFTGVKLSMPEFLGRAREQIDTFSGMKFTNPDLLAYQECVRVYGAEIDVFWGLDELLLAALAFGCRGAVGATYNFAAPLYHRLIAAFERGDLEAARTEQYRSVQFIKVLNRYGFLGAAKALMKMLGIDVGPARLPNTNPSTTELRAMRQDLDELGFFQWITAK